MDREAFFKFGGNYIKVVNGKALRCKDCDTPIPHDADHQELRHSCISGTANLRDEEDPRFIGLDPEADENDAYGARLAAGTDYYSYGEDMYLLEGVSERW
jgi:hypothetical protein